MLNNLSEKSIIDAAETGLMNYFDELGLQATVSWDFVRFRELVSSHYGWVNPTVDYTCRPIHPASFWVGLTDAAGHFVAFKSYAYFDSGDFEGLFRNGELFWSPDKRPDDFSRMGQVHSLSRFVPAPFTHAGSQWTDRNWRDLYLAHYLTVLSRLVTLRYLDVKFFTGCILDEIKTRTVPNQGYDYPEDGINLLLKGYSPHAKKMVTLYGCHMERNVAVARLAGRIMPRPPAAPAKPSVVQAHAQS